MIFGQWFGYLKGDVSGELIFNIDKALDHGSLSILPNDGTFHALLVFRIDRRARLNIEEIFMIF